MAAYRQYTQCVDISNFNPANPYTQAALVGLYVTLPIGAFQALLMLAGVGSPLCLLLLAEIYFIAGVIGYCYWWLYRRLICIPATVDHPNDSTGNQMVIGTLIDTLPPSDATFPDIDNDFSLGLLPACIPLGSQGPYTAANPAPGSYGYLVTEQPVTHDAGLTYTGQRGTDYSFSDTPTLDIQSEILHCEFEGRAIYDMFLAAQAALLPVVAAVFACQIPVYGWLVALILALLGLGLLALGYGIGKTDDGAPTDINPNLGELHTNDKNHQGADTLLIIGHWVCDAGHRYDHHALYYELHPITFACKTTPVTDCDPGQVIFLKERWKAAVGDATSPATLASQKLPQNQWQIHPILDGCEAAVII